MAVCLALSLAQLHSLIIHLLIGHGVDKAFKLLNPCYNNMSNMHMVYVLCNSQPEVEHDFVTSCIALYMLWVFMK